MTTVVKKPSVAWSETHLLDQQSCSLGVKSPILQSIQSEGLARYLAKGFPTRRDESWKYVPLHGLSKMHCSLPTVKCGASEQTLSPYFIEDTYRLVFLDGQLLSQFSDAKDLLAHIQMDTLSAACQKERADVVQDLKNKPGFSDAFVDLNVGLMTEGLCIRIPENTGLDKPLHILHVTSGHQSLQMCHPRHLIHVGAGAKVDIIEDYVSLSSGAYFNNIVTQVYLERNAHCRHYYWQRESSQSFHVNHADYTLCRDSVLHRFDLIMGAQMGRVHAQVQLKEPGAETRFCGCYCTKGEQHHDIDLYFNHQASNTRSSQRYRGVIDDHASASFCGLAKVDEGISSIVAEQTNNNLLLSEYAQAYTRPQLEIYSEDVSCSHGATIGALDEAVLFYLQSRGIARECAQQLLLQSFVSEVYDTCTTDLLREIMVDRIKMNIL